MLGIGLLLILFNLSPTEVQAQEKSVYEKINDKRNKANRRLKRRGDKAARKKRKSYTRFKMRSKQGDRAHQGDITGRKVRSRISLTERSRAAHPQPNPYAGRKRSSEASRAKAFNRTVRYSKKPREKAWKGSLSGGKLQFKGYRSKRSRVSPRTSPRSGGGIIGERDGGRFSGQGFKGIRSISRSSEKGKRYGRVVPRSASGAYRVRKRKNPYIWRERSKWESAFQGDITGRKFQTKRTTERPVIQKPQNVKFSFQGKGRRGDRAYQGQMTGGYKSVSSRKEKAWKNDISGTKLRIRTSERPDFSGTQFKPYPQRGHKGDKAFRGKLKGGGFKTAGRDPERAGSKALPSKPPGAGTQRAFRFQGNIKTKKPLKGGGSISRNQWNNRGRAIEGRGPQGQDLKIARFQGNVKGLRPKKGGGSISGTRWNNNGRAIEGRGPQGQDLKIAKFQGNIKGLRPKKGGGSISGKRWNNKGNAIEGRGPQDQDFKVAKHQGNLRQWKYQTGPLDDTKFTGNIKRKSNYLRNPNAVKEALKVREPRNLDKQAANYTGNIRQWKYKTGPLDEMKYTGNLKRPKYKKNPHAADESLKVKPAQKNDKEAFKFQGFTKLSFKYKKNPQTADESLKVRPPGKNYEQARDFQGRFKRSWKAKHNPNSADDALKARAPTSETVRATKFQGRFKMTAQYQKRPHSADDALRGIGPSKAAIKASNYQGNIKMKKGIFKDKHPSYKFVQPNNSVAQKTKFSLRLLWAKWFKKSDNQPDNLKEKERKPRYDKGEQGLWNE